MSIFKRSLLCFFLLAGLLSCKKELKHEVDTEKEIVVENSLLTRLKELNKQGILFGHQDDLAYGIGWKYQSEDSLDSDVKRLTGSFPSIFGWDLGGIGTAKNLDGVPFKDMIDLIIQGDALGGISTLSWHPFLPNDSTDSWNVETKIVDQLLPQGKYHTEFKAKLDHVAHFFSSLKNKQGQPIQVIFRPWHEMNGSWFWWGSDHCTPEEFKALFAFTVDYLRNEKGLDNLTIAYSPDRGFHDETSYLTWYPGDQYIDILGVDNYHDFTENGDGLDAIANKLSIVYEVAKAKGKLAAFTETGSDKIEDDLWYTKKLGKVLDTNDLTKKISYVLVWRNHDKKHFYVPYKDHPAQQDFVEFTNRKDVLLLKDIKN